MGRTLPPFSQLIEHERRSWAPFRRALRKDDQAAFDRLFDCAKLHVQAGVYLSRPWPFEVIAMAMLLEHTGHEPSAARIMQAVQHVTGTKMKSQAAGKMGYGTREVGDLVVAALDK